MTTCTLLQNTTGSFKASDLLIQRIEQPKARQATQVLHSMPQHTVLYGTRYALPTKSLNPCLPAHIGCAPSEQRTGIFAVQDLVFGASFTDHMFLVEHVEGQGWGQPVIKPFGHIPMHPAAQALHYGVCCFEGMKGYLGKDGKARLFRSDGSTLVACMQLPLFEACSAFDARV